jgi:hypothetical protein
MLMQVAPRNARPRNPENPIQNKTMVPRATTTARAALNHEWFKAGPFLVAHQTPEHDSFPKSYRESENTPVGNPLCQHLLVLDINADATMGGAQSQASNTTYYADGTHPTNAGYATLLHSIELHCKPSSARQH